MFVSGINCNCSMDELRTDVNRVMSDVFGGLAEWTESARRPFPAVNVWEDERAVFAEAELPGMKTSDIEIFIQGDELTIKGERSTRESETATFHRRECGLGAFRRIVQLPTRVNTNAVEATLCDGVLTVTMPKAEDVVPKKIKVSG